MKLEIDTVGMARQMPVLYIIDTKTYFTSTFNQADKRCTVPNQSFLPYTWLIYSTLRPFSSAKLVTLRLAFTMNMSLKTIEFCFFRLQLPIWARKTGTMWGERAEPCV